MSWAQEAHARLAAAGHRTGGARAAVIDALDATGGCLSAHEIGDHLVGEGRRVGTASIYRALATLTEVGALRGRDVGEGVVRYELVHPSGEHHHHMVCDRCGATEPFEDPALERAIARLAARAPYVVADHDVVLRGTCPRCLPTGEQPAPAS
jgi:Fur family ferric uptake transcriptional regulator